MKPLPEGQKHCPRKCAADSGWDYSNPDDPRWCDHGALERAVAVAEAHDRVIADRRRRATGATQ